MSLIERFQNLAEKIGQVARLIENAVGDDPPEFLNVHLKINIDLPSGEAYCLVIAKEESRFDEGFDAFTSLRMKADEQFWIDVFDGKISVFGGYTQGRVYIPNYRLNRFNIFLISGLISMLLNLKMKL